MDTDAGQSRGTRWPAHESWGLMYQADAPTKARGLPRVRDVLYGDIPLPGWVRALLGTRLFRRLAGVSLSDVPGELLFGHAFPSRLDHALGVYYLTRLARPRDRTLQVAALAHDLGHGPFSHLTEALLHEHGGEDHEQRSARFLRAMHEDLSSDALRQLAWLDWDEAARLVVAGQGDGRGELLNGRLDYDNIDNVVRFLLAARLGRPSYDPVALARGLRLLPTRVATRLSSTEGMPLARGRGPLGTTPVWAGRVLLLDALRAEAQGWQADRAIVYTYLHEGHVNLALHATLRKAIDLALQANALPSDFLDMTDGQALRILWGLRRPEIALLLSSVNRTRHYQCEWELEVPPGGENPLPRRLLRWRYRLRLEERLATEAGLLPHEVITEMITSSAARALPPVAVDGRLSELILLPATSPAPARLHVFAPPGVPRDYVRRLCIAAERHFGGIGTVIRSAVG